MELKNIVNVVCGSLGFSAVVAAAACIKMNYIVGSHMAHFSAATAVAPLAGVQGVGFGIVTFLLGTFFKFLMGVNPFSYLLYHIPSLCGALFWAGGRIFFGVVVPLACMVLFVAHPQGAGAWLYTMYWLIPMVLVATGRRHLFASALSCSFIMHAVGSVIWLYTVHIPTPVWLSLIPVVFVERLLLAGAMTSGFVIMQEVKKIFFSTHRRKAKILRKEIAQQ